MGTGRRLSAAEALEWGLVSEVVEPDDFSGRVSEFAAQLAAGPTRALALTKRLFEGAVSATLEEQLQLEAEFQNEVIETADFAEALAAFAEKRKPEFIGR